jgi:CheY-like chemotaxis protein
MVRLSPNLAPNDGAPTVRILVVEDYLPFRQYMASTPARTGDLQVICEVADGLEAVHRAEELKPDLIFLDIGLPTLAGIEAARRIRQLCPESKIIFVSHHTSLRRNAETNARSIFARVIRQTASWHDEFHATPHSRPWLIRAARAYPGRQAFLA